MHLSTKLWEGTDDLQSSSGLQKLRMCLILVSEIAESIHYGLGADSPKSQKEPYLIEVRWAPVPPE